MIFSPSISYIYRQVFFLFHPSRIWMPLFLPNRTFVIPSTTRIAIPIFPLLCSVVPTTFLAYIHTSSTSSSSSLNTTHSSSSFKLHPPAALLSPSPANHPSTPNYFIILGSISLSSGRFLLLIRTTLFLRRNVLRSLS